jgi:CBS domain-containing protein
MPLKTLGTLVTYNPWSIGPTTLLDDVAVRFEELRVHHVAVVDADRRVIGMLSESDLLRARQSRRAVLVGPSGSDTSDAPLVFARDCMSRIVHSITPTADFPVALGLLLERRIHALPVIESGRLTGMVTSRDFLREFSYGELPASRESVSSLLTANPPKTLDTDATLDEALLAMHDQGVSCLAVVQGDCPVGIASQRDIVRGKCRLDECEDDHTALRLQRTVSQVIRSSPAVRRGQRLCEAASAMIAGSLPGVTVVDETNRLLGLITEDDLLRVLYDAQA